MTPEETMRVVGTIPYLNSLSLVSCFLMMLLFFTYVRKKQPAHFRRTSLRLLMMISIADAMIATSNILNYHMMDEETAICTPGVFMYIFGSLSSAFLFVCFAHNLYQVVSGSRHLLTMPVYAMASFAMAAVIASAPLAAGMYGWNRTSNICWFIQKDNGVTFFWIWGTFFMWLGLASIYMVIMFFMTVRTLNKRFANGESGRAGREKVRQVTTRTSLFLIVPTITQALNVIFETEKHISEDPKYWLFMTLFIALGLQGFMNVVVFLFDTSLSTLVKDIVASIRRILSQRSPEPTTLSSSVAAAHGLPRYNLNAQQYYANGKPLATLSQVSDPELMP